MQTTTSDGGKAMPRTFVQGAAPSSELQQCITNCMTCSAVCEQTLQYCIKQGGKHAEAQMGDDPVMKQCAEVCRTCAASCRSMAAS
jgi:hypothetical protein